MLGPEVSAEAFVSDFKKVKFDHGLRLWAISAGSKSMLPTDADAHDFGCRVAAKANAAKGLPATAGEENPDKRVFYRGSYEMHVGSIADINDTEFKLAVYFWPSIGLKEHCSIAVEVSARRQTDEEFASIKTFITSELGRLLLNPSEHICGCDAAVTDMLADIHLPDFNPARVVGGAGGDHLTDEGQEVPG